MGPFQPRVFYGSVILSMLKLCISYKDLKERHLEISKRCLQRKELEQEEQM